MERGCCHVFARVTLNSTQKLIASTFESLPQKEIFHTVITAA